MADLIFQQLQSGTRFGGGKRKQQPKADKSNDQPAIPASAPSLDFFGYQKNEQKPKKRSKKKKKAEPIVEQDHEDDEENKEDGDEMADVSNRSRKAIRKLRVKYNIKTERSDAQIPDIITDFDELKTKYQATGQLIANVKKIGYTKPTPIQMQAIPALLENNELLACAPTGSGKTAAFAIPMLMHLKSPSEEPHRALVLSPTRELAIQTFQHIEALCEGTKFRVCMLTKSTSPIESDDPVKRRRYDIIVTTPLRLVRLIEHKAFQLETIKFLVMDEADQLFEFGFLKQIDEIIAACSNKNVLRCLFSATMPEGVEQMARSFLRNPVRVTIGNKNSAADTLSQRLIYCGQEEGKTLALRQLIREGITPPVIIFVQSKDRALELYHELLCDHLNIGIITSDRTKSERDQTVQQFHEGNIWVLIATDLMARGMDFHGVNLVINFDIPSTAVQYIHRIGRAGRAGLPGKAVTFYTSEDVKMLRTIVNVMKNSGMKMPEWMNILPKATIKQQKRFAAQPIAREPIYKVPKKLTQREKLKLKPAKKTVNKTSQ